MAVAVVAAKERGNKFMVLKHMGQKTYFLLVKPVANNDSKWTFPYGKCYIFVELLFLKILNQTCPNFIH